MRSAVNREVEGSSPSPGAKWSAIAGSPFGAERLNQGRAGLGRRLEDELERIARGEGCGRIDLTSRHHRNEAHAFYRVLGFEETSLRFVKDLG